MIHDKRFNNACHLDMIIYLGQEREEQEVQSTTETISLMIQIIATDMKSAASWSQHIHPKCKVFKLCQG